MPDIWFPFLGIEIPELSRIAFTIGSFSIAWYGIIIAFGFLCGFFLCILIARKTKQDTDYYWTFFIFGMVLGIAGARAYYVIFEWDSFKKATFWDTFLAIVNLRSGGLAIYGGIIAVFITGLIYAKVKKYNFLLMADTCMPCLALGQAIGRWGNFFNQEAFGSYCDGLFAMRLNVDTVYYKPAELMEKAITIDGTTYIQVHPTFLYESFGCLCLVILMLVATYFRHKIQTTNNKKVPLTNGHILCIYLIGYGTIRAFVENLRTDSLYIGDTDIRVSVVVSVVIAIAGVILSVLLILKKMKENKKEVVNEPQA